MKCPFCKCDSDRVIDSRASDDGYVIRRRRQCLACNKRFTTLERVTELDLRVVKKDGSREPFNPDKIRSGLERACWKRPIPTDVVERAGQEILQEIFLVEGSEIESSLIGEIVLSKLFRLDHVAFIRFASVYRQYRDVNDFVRELQPILQRLDGKSPTSRTGKTRH